MPRPVNTIERLMRKVKQADTCWVWQGSVNKVTGYGGVTVNYRYKGAHRAVYEGLVGAVPKGYELDHLCRNRLCVNPLHLEPVTRKENVRRSTATKLSLNQVAQVRKLAGTGLKQAEIAEAFEISPCHVSRLINYKRVV